MMNKLKYLLTIILGSSFLLLHAQTVPNLKIVNRIHIEGDEKWDYLSSDDVASCLYVSHGNMVQVVDETSGKAIGKITGLNGVHGIAIASALNKGFISSGKDSSVVIFDLKTLNVISRITVTGRGPDAIMFDPYSNKVFVFNGKTNNATVISAETNKILATISLEGKPESSVSDCKGNVFVNLEDKSSIAVINTQSYKVDHVWPIAPGEEPTGLAIDVVNHLLFSVCGNKIMVIADSETGKVVTTLPIGERCDGVAIDPEMKRIYISNGDKTMSVVKEEKDGKFSVMENFPTQEGARTITVNRLTHHIYLSAADFEPPKDGQKAKILPGTFVVLDIETQ
jgi:DNA-binding beta-propeller fold protein YncE